MRSVRSDKVDKKKKYPPSYYRYRKAHPTIAIVLSSSLKSFIDEYRGNRTYPAFIVDILNNGKAVSEKIEAEYQERLRIEMDRFIESKNKEYREKLNQELMAREESIDARLRESISGQVKEIRNKILKSFVFNEEGKSKVWWIFENGFRVPVDEEEMETEEMDAEDTE